MQETKDILKSKGLKVTPQRIAILEALHTLRNHPTADSIINYVRTHHPHIAVGTVYKVLDTLIKNDLVFKVHTDSDITRYDVAVEKHHHIYCAETNAIGDYVDNKLDEILEDYFKKIDIPNFKVEDIKLMINGKFISK